MSTAPCGDARFFSSTEKNSQSLSPGKTQPAQQDSLSTAAPRAPSPQPQLSTGSSVARVTDGALGSPSSLTLGVSGSGSYIGSAGPDGVRVAEHSPAYTQNQHGHLRFKIEHREDTLLYFKTFYKPTWDGIIKSKRFMSMSCSDKILKWNLLGLQVSFLNCVSSIFLSFIKNNFKQLN